MKSFSQGLRVQVKVIKALIVRELVTRFGRDNIGFLWIVAEPLLFAGLVGLYGPLSAVSTREVSAWLPSL